MSTTPPPSRIRAQLGTIRSYFLAFSIIRLGAIVLGVLSVIGLVYLVLGKPGAQYLLEKLFAAILGFLLGLAWPFYKRILFRPGRTIEVGGYFTFASQLFPLKALDGPVTYQSHELVFEVSGRLQLPEYLIKAHGHMVDRMKSYAGDKVLFDGACFVLASAPLIRRSWEGVRERPTIVVDFKQTTYFVRVLMRGAMSDELREHIEQDWPNDIPHLSDLRRAALMESDDFSPFLHPGAGIDICLVAYDRAGRPWTLVQRRGAGIAENTGIWATSLHESFSSDDVTSDSLIDPFLTANRAAREELGISLNKIEYFVVAIDEGSLPGKKVARSGGFELIGCAETSLPAERLEDTRFRGRDKFEAVEIMALELNVDSLVSIFRKAPPDQWFPPALLAICETLERLRPGSWHRLAAQVEAIAQILPPHD